MLPLYHLFLTLFLCRFRLGGSFIRRCLSLRCIWADTTLMQVRRTTSAMVVIGTQAAHIILVPMPTFGIRAAAVGEGSNGYCGRGNGKKNLWFHRWINYETILKCKAQLKIDSSTHLPFYI